MTSDAPSTVSARSTSKRLSRASAARTTAVALSRAPAVFSRLITTLARQGPRSTYHLYQELLARYRHKRTRIEPHLATRLNILGAQKCGGLCGILKVARCSDVRQLDFDIVHQRSDQLDDKFRLLSVTDISDLYTYFRYFGDFRIANYFRIQLLEAYTREQQKASDVIPEALAAAIELGTPEFILDTIKRKKIHGRDQIAVDKAESIAYLLVKDETRARKLFARTFQKQDYLFEETVKGRSVAVVGPSPNVDEFSREGQLFDLIVRTNYQGTNVSATKYNTDISYYNQVRLVRDGDEIVTAAPELKWLCAIRHNDKPLRDLVISHKGIRSANDALPLFLHANPLAIPIILNDLIRFQPARIKFFCIDFFASAAAYDSVYHRLAKRYDAISHSIRIHDPFSSYSFVKRFFELGMCAADRQAAEILDLGRKRYAARLQKLYGSYFVADRHPH